MNRFGHRCNLKLAHFFNSIKIIYTDVVSSSEAIASAVESTILLFHCDSGVGGRCKKLGKDVLLVLKMLEKIVVFGNYGVGSACDGSVVGGATRGCVKTVD